MSISLSMASTLAALMLSGAEVNDNGTTGEWRVHSGSPETVHEIEVEFDPMDAGIAGTVPTTGWVSALGFELRGRTSAFDFASSSQLGSMWCVTGSAERFADVRLDIPDSARITFFRMWGFDGSAANDLAAFLFESCLPNLAAGQPVNTNLAQLTSAGASGDFTATTALAAPQPVTNTRLCTYWARVRYAPDCAGGGTLILRKFRVQYTVVD